MGNTWGHEEKVACFAYHFVLKVRAPPSAYPAPQYIDSGLVAYVDVWLGAPTRRNDDQVHREASSVHGLARYGYEVRQA